MRVLLWENSSVNQLPSRFYCKPIKSVLKWHSLSFLFFLCSLFLGNNALYFFFLFLKGGEFLSWRERHVVACSLSCMPVLGAMHLPPRLFLASSFHLVPNSSRCFFFSLLTWKLAAAFVTHELTCVLGVRGCARTHESSPYVRRESSKLPGSGCPCRAVWYLSLMEWIRARALSRWAWPVLSLHPEHYLMQTTAVCVCV